MKHSKPTQFYDTRSFNNLVKNIEKERTKEISNDDIVKACFLNQHTNRSYLNGQKIESKYGFFNIRTLLHYFSLFKGKERTKNNGCHNTPKKYPKRKINNVYIDPKKQKKRKKQKERKLYACNIYNKKKIW
jgi:hypothetical protein